MGTEQNITASRTTFAADGKNVSGYLAAPTKGASSAVIVIHEWWGLNRHIEDIAERLARAGYLAAAVDLYGGVTTKDPGEASKLMSGLDQAKALDDLETVVKHVRAMPGISHVGVTGFCMGGTFSLLLPCRTALDAAAPFYGDVPVDTSFLADLSCPVLFIGGEKDEWITVEKMNRLDAALKEHRKEGEVRIYIDAPHAFFNDTRTEVYRAGDAANAWTRVLEFFERNLRKGQATSA